MNAITALGRAADAHALDRAITRDDAACGRRTRFRLARRDAATLAIAAPAPLTSVPMVLPADHPAFYAVGGDAFHAAASDLVARARKARALAQVNDPVTRAMKVCYHAASSGSYEKGEFGDQLRARGVTHFDGVLWPTPRHQVAA